MINDAVTAASGHPVFQQVTKDRPLFFVPNIVKAETKMGKPKVATEPPAMKGRREEIARLHKEGLSPATIAERLGVSKSTVYRWIK